jgi:VRR-NUC domain
VIALPPLLALAQGRKVRPRSAPVVRPKEIILHFQVAKVLRQHIRPDWQWTHIGHGEVRDVRTAAKLKAMGARRGWPDFILIPPTGQTCCLELKRLGEGLSEDQAAFQNWCIRHAVPHSVCHSLDEALTVFDQWRCLTITQAGRMIGGAP